MPKRLNRETAVESICVLDNSIDNKEKVNKSRSLEKTNSNKLHLSKSSILRSNASKGTPLESVDKKQAHNLNRLTAEVSTTHLPNKLELDVTKIPTSFDADNEDISGISFKFSQEPLLNSSQDDSFCDVKWDCGSPETIQKVKRWRGHYNAESVKNAVSYFSDIHVKPQKNASNKVGTILHSKDLIALATKSRPQKSKERVCKKKPHDFQEMVDSFLQDLTKKNQTGVEETFSSSSVGNVSSTKLCDIELETKVDVKTSADDSCWSDDDLFKDNSFLIEATQNQESCFKSVSSNNTNANLQKSPPLITHNSSHEPSTTPLRHDNSNSLLNDSSVIPSSCVAEQPGKVSSVLIKSLESHCEAPSNVFNKPGDLQTLHHNSDKRQVQNTFIPNHDATLKVNHKHVVTHNTKLSAEYQAKCNESINKFVNKNSHELISLHGNSQSSITPIPLSNQKIQTSFKKYSSFQNEISKQPYTFQTNSPNNSLRKTHSFDSSCSKSSLQSLPPQRLNLASTSSMCKTKNSNLRCDSNDVQTLSGHTAASRPNSERGIAEQKTFSFVSSKNFSKLKSTATTGYATEFSTDDGKSRNHNRKIAENCVNCATGDGFDVSLPEDVLEQLLEPDEIFDSQADILFSSASTESKTTDKLMNTKLKYNVKKLPVTQLGKNYISSGQNNPSTTTLKQSTCDNVNQNYIPSSSNNAATLLSPVKQVSDVQKRNQMNSKSPVQTFFKKTCSSDNTSFRTNSSTPVKDSKSITFAIVQSNIRDANKNSGVSDSFLDNAFDDSFLNDEAVYESQILPYLEKVESDAIKETESQVTATLSSSPVQCSQEQIEQKRLAAIQKRSLRLSQTKKSN